MSTLPTSEDGRISFNRGGEPDTDSTLTFDVNTQTLNCKNLNIDGTTTEPPAGSDKYVQFNDGGSFGGDSDLQWNKTTNVLTVTGTVSASTLTASGSVATSQNSAPADGTISANQLKIWFDSTDGAAKVMFKGKSADGTVVAGEVALT